MDQRAFEAVPRSAIDSIEYVAAGQDPTGFAAGDFILTHGDAWTSRMIRFGQGLRIHGADRVYTHWNHTALVVDDNGDIVEALGRGVCRRNLTAYQPKEYKLVRLTTSPENRAEAIRFARWAAGETDPDGDPISPELRSPIRYGFVTILSIAYSLLTGGKFSFSIAGQEICSGLVARSLERTGVIFGKKPPTHMMPADLAKYFRCPGPG
jgi:hypothetical protein